MGATIGKAIDYLVAGLAAPVAATDVTAQVHDTYPATVGDSFIIIGRSNPDDDSVGTTTSEYAYLGAGRISEDYEISGVVHTERPGPDAKPARDAAVTLLDVVIVFVHADPTLGGLLQQGRIGFVSQYELHQTGSGSNSAEMLAEIPFRLHIQNTYIP